MSKRTVVRTRRNARTASTPEIDRDVEFGVAWTLFHALQEGAMLPRSHWNDLAESQRYLISRVAYHHGYDLNVGRCAVAIANG